MERWGGGVKWEGFEWEGVEWEGNEGVWSVVAGGEGWGRMACRNRVCCSRERWFRGTNQTATL